jgi:hypothetical protein
MNKKSEYSEISQRSRSILESEENYDFEFKESLSGLDSSDIVAFANSGKGGTILVGIREKKLANGKRVGEIIGCKIGDQERLKILNKARSCIPPIDIEIIYENTSTTPFIRIEIPSCNEKPCCTQGGSYLIRGDGQNRALHPGLLFGIFLEREYEVFAQRFKDASNEIEKTLVSVKTTLNSEIEDIKDEIDDLSRITRLKLDEIFGSAQDAVDNSDQAMTLADESSAGINEVDDKIERLKDQVEWVTLSLEAILKKFEIEDPIITNLRVHFQYLIKEAKSKAARQKIILDYQNRYKGIPKDNFIKWSES